MSAADAAHFNDRTPPASAKSTNTPPPIPALQPILAAPPPPGLDQRLVSVNVTDPSVSVRDVMIELTRKVGVDIDLASNVSGGVIFTATDRPFSEVVSRICDLANLRCTFKNNVLNVQIDSMYYQTYNLDILNAARTATSTVSTNTDVSSAVQGGGGSGAGTSSSQVQTTSPPQGVADQWTELNNNLGDILANSNPLNQPITSNVAALNGGPAPGPAPGTAAAVAAAAGTPAPPANAPAGAAGAGATTNGSVSPASLGTVGQLASAAQALGNAASGVAAQAANAAPAAAAGPAAALAATTAKASFDINRNSGLVTIFGTDRQQKLVRNYLRSVLDKANAQVLIESKVVEVDLTSQFAAGIDWQKVWTFAGRTLTVGGSFGPDQTSSSPGGAVVASALGATAPSAFAPLTLASGDGSNNLTAALSFIEQFGTVRTLSSPRLTVMNNQTAVLKVAQNQVYFTLQFTVTPTTNGGVTTNTVTASSTLHTVPIGVVMTVQPSINPDTGQVTMSLRPTVSQQVGQVNDPSIPIVLANSCAGQTTGICSSAGQAQVTSAIPVVEVRELDSVITVGSGELIVLGGLMQQSDNNTKSGIPGAQDLPVIGNAFKATADKQSTTELVVFLKATIVHGADSIDWADKDLYQRYVHDPRPLGF